jgi:hypothetical protein
MAQQGEGRFYARVFALVAGALLALALLRFAEEERAI